MQKTTSFRANALRTSVSLALAAGMTSGYGVAFAQDSATATEGRVEVTGSRIKRADLEGALPVTVIDREQIELSGQVSVADLLRNTSFNSFGSFRPQSGSSAQSFAGLSLRGLGTGRTLILIDGRRAPVAPTVGGSQDLNTIPLAAVERIEILSDGASAIYGTDAIGGVINIITRKDFSGAEFNFGKSAPTREGGDTEEGSIMFGAAGDRGRILGGVSYENRHIVFQRDRPWSAGGASVFSNNFMVATVNPASIYGFSPTNTALAHPTFGSVPPGGCGGPGYTVIGPTCAYDFTFTAADEADIRNKALFVRGEYQINDDWSTYMNASITRVTSFGRYAPVPSSPWPGGLPFIPVGSPNHPGNPLGYNAANAATYGNVAPVFLRHRFAALGNRDNFIDSHNYDVMAGFQGRIGGIDLDIGARHNESKSIGLGENYVVAAIAQNFINNGQYNIYDPFNSGPATANTPAYNTPTVMNAMIARTSRIATFIQKEVYAMGNMDLPFELGGGVVAAAFGIEYRDESYVDSYDSLSEAGQIVGSSGSSAGGGRTAGAAYFEVLLPFTSDLEVSIAGRYDDYSDFGTAFSPKISFRWQPMDDLTLRLSYGEGFAAPSLGILTQQPAFGAATTNHQPTCIAFFGHPCGTLANSVAPGTPATNIPGSTQVTTYSIANPNLGAEESKNWSAGLAWDATSWLNLSLDYYNIKLTNTISGIGLGTVVGCLEGTVTVCPPGISNFGLFQPPVVAQGLGVYFDPNDGSIVFAQTGFGNLGELSTSGLDFNARMNFDFGNYGSLRTNLQLGRVLDYAGSSGVNAVGEDGLPQHRAGLSNIWAIGDFEVVWNLSYIDGQESVNGARCRLGLGSCNVALPLTLPSWVTHDLQVNYHAPWNARMTLGVRNLTNRGPVEDPNDPTGRGYRMNLYDGYGRVPYFRYRQTF